MICYGTGISTSRVARYRYRWFANRLLYLNVSYHSIRYRIHSPHDVSTYIKSQYRYKKFKILWKSGKKAL